MRALRRAIVLGLWLVAAADGATIPVTTTADELNTDGDCSLREAVVAANTDAAVDACPAGSGADEITLPAGTYPRTLTGANENAAATGDLDLVGTVSIVGAHRTTTIIEGDADDRLFEVRSGAVARLDSLTLRDATPAHAGAVALNRATLTVHNCTLEDNLADGATGGALYSISTSTLTITDSVFEGNEAGTTGGALANHGTTTITNVSFIANTAGQRGGAIYQSPNGSLDVDAVLFLFNEAAEDGGAIYTDAPTTIASSNFMLNSVGNVALGGGALSCADTVTVTHSLVAYNTSQTWAGGIATNALCTLALTNVTIHGNSAAESGGGIRLSGGDVTLTNCTVSSNASDTDSMGSGGGGGIDASSGGTVTLRNTVVADNVDAGAPSDCEGTLTSEGHNLLETTTACTMALTTGDVTGSDPMLGPLADNGGATDTQLPHADSPLVDGGDPATPGSGGAACAADDQRGYPRPAGTACDVGAVERDATPPTTTTVATTTTTTTTTVVTTTTTTTTVVGTTTTTTTTLPGASTTTSSLPGTTTTTVTTTSSSTPATLPPTTTTLPPPPPLCADGVAMQGMTLRLTRLGGAAGDERLVLAGTLLLAPGTPPALSPATSGLQLLIEDQGAGDALVDLTTRSTPIPPGARGAGCHAKDGWNGLTYVNRSGAVGPGCRAGSAQGVRRMRLKDHRSRGRGVAFTVQAQGATLPMPAGPVRVTLVLGAQPGAGAQGLCGTHVFAGSCTAKGATYRCR